MLERNGTAGDLFAGAIDPERIAASGWSYGGYNATILASGHETPCAWLAPNPPAWACEPSLPDARVRALILLDPGTWALDQWDLKRVQVPVISIHQSYASLISFGLWGGWNAYHHAFIRGSPNFRVDINQSNHHRFGIACEFQTVLFEYGYITRAQRDATLAARLCFDPDRLPTWQVMYPLIAEYAIAFLETTFRGAASEQRILTPGHALTRETFVEFFVSEPISPDIPLDHVHEFWFFPHQAGALVEQADVSAGRPGRVFQVEDE